MPDTAADPHAALLSRIEAGTLAPEAPLLARLRETARLSPADRAAIAAEGADLVRGIRAASRPGRMELFLAEYGLSTDEGIALMCLAEALLRVPDAATIDALIEDKIAPADWGRHLGRSASPLVNASTWALMLTGKVLDDGAEGRAGVLRGALKRLGEPVIRRAVAAAMRELGRQFVLGEDIAAAMARAKAMEAQGYRYSYDMLGEAARTEACARGYLTSYARAIDAIAGACRAGPVHANPGISVKLSALHPRYEEAQRARVMAELVPRLAALARAARAAGMGLSVDAEEADRLALSLDVIEAVAADDALAGWDGFGLVVQAYSRRCGAVLDWLEALAGRLGRRFAVRLVKGAYWDSEIKRAQVEGLEDFPVFTGKPATDISYIANARRLIGMADRLYPQFATHNAHTAAAVLHMTCEAGLPAEAWEFQRLHGMGEALHALLRERSGARCRIYAPVGVHADLLAYLVRRLLENGANSSFVHRIMDPAVPPEAVAADPFEAPPGRKLPTGPELFAPARRNSRGFDLTDRPTLRALEAARAPFATATWQAGPDSPQSPGVPVRNPADGSPVGTVHPATEAEVQAAAAAARPWAAAPHTRADTLRRAADLYEANAPEIFALLAREAGKALPDAVAELREAVDFLRYYAAEAERLGASATGLWAAIGPWNFPLAIFTGQIAAALAAGNAVLAKPAPQTSLIAARAVAWLHTAGVPDTALALLPGGAETGAALTRLPGLDGVAFTGSTATARRIAQALPDHARPGTRLIAETGGINCMIVDSTALPEAAVRDIVTSAFRSAGQRCSALRCLYVQHDIADRLIPLLTGAMDALTVGDPWHLATDLGPVIDDAAAEAIRAHIATARAEGRVLHECATAGGRFIGPTLIRVDGVAAVEREVFGPVLHLATFRAEALGEVIAAINGSGHGLTFGLHTRIDDRVDRIVREVRAGNLYVNRNQIGAVVGSQPFGGEGLSGTGPKAGGPHYLPVFLPPARPSAPPAPWPHRADLAALAAALRSAAPAPVAEHDMPGPTGEANRLTLLPRPPLLCLGPGAEAARAQAAAVEALGGQPAVPDGAVPPAELASLPPFGAALWWGDTATARTLVRALAERAGPLLPLITALPDAAQVLFERHVCIDTTAAGGNAALLAGEVSDPMA